MAKTSPIPPPSDGLEVGQVAAPESYAEKASEAFERLSEGTKSFAGKTIEFLSTGAKKMWEIFKDANLLGKGAMVAAGVVVGLAANKIVEKVTGFNVVEKGVALFRATWDKMTGLGDSLSNGLDKIRGISIKKTIAILLGSTALVALFANFSDLKAFWDEANDHPDGLLTGLQAGITTRVLDGVFDISDEKWDELAENHSWFPSRERRDKAKEVLDDAKESLGNVKEGLEGGMDWLQEFDRDSGLKALRGRMWGYLDEKFAGWRDSPIMAALMELDDPSKIMAHLSLDTPEKRSAFLEELRDNAVGAGGVATVSYLLLRLLKTPWAGAITGVNVALYMVFQNEKVDTALVSAFACLHEAAEWVRHQLQVVTTQMGLKPEWLLLQEEGLGVKSMMDYMFEKMEDHPDLTALTLLNATFLSHRVIWSVIKEALKFIMHAGAEAIKFIIDHTLTASLILGGGVLTFIERRRLIDDLAWALYPEDFKARTKFKEETFDFLDKTEFTRVDENPSVAEAALVPIYDRLVRDPIEFFSDPDNEFRLEELTRDGHIEWHVWESGKTVTLGFLGGVNPYNNAVQIEWNMFEAMLDEWAARGVTMDNMHVYVTQAGGLALGGAAIYGAVNSGMFILSDFNGSARQFSRFLKMMVHPASREFRQILKSMVRASADMLTFGQATEILQGLHLTHISAEIDGIFRVVESGYNQYGGKEAFKNTFNSGEGSFFSRAQEGFRAGMQQQRVPGILQMESFVEVKLDLTRFYQYKKNLSDLISTLEKVGEDGKTRATSLVHYADSDLVNYLREIWSDVDKLEDHLKSLEKATTQEAIDMAKQEITASMEKLRSHYQEGQTRWSRSFRRVQQFVDKGVLRKPASLSEVAAEGTQPRPLPEFKTELMRRYARRATALGLSPETLLEIEKLPLTESQLRQFLKDLKHDPSLANQAYAVLKHPRSAALVRALEKGAPLAFVLAITYGFDHADNKIEFLTHEGPRIAAAFPAMKYADQFVGSKMPHPLLRIGVDLLAGAGAATGVGMVFDHVVMEPVARRFPNWNNPEALTKARLRDGSYILAMAAPLGPVFDVAEVHLEKVGIGDGVSPGEDPLDYLFDTVRRFRGFKEGRDSADESPIFFEARLHTTGDLEENAGKSALKWEEKVERQRARLEEMRAKGADSTDEGYRRASLKLERLERELTQLERMRDGLWLEDVRLDIYQRDFFIQILKESYGAMAEEQFSDRGKTFVDTLYSRVGTGQDLVDEADKDIWTFLLDQEDLNGPDGSTYSFRKWIALEAFNKLRRNQIKSLGFSSDLPKSYFDRPHDDRLHPDAPEEPAASEEPSPPLPNS